MKTIPFPTGSLVAAYFRDSGGDTQELSVPQQENAFNEWCVQNSLIPGAVFRDIARPGSSVIGRAGFHDMIHHFRSGQAREVGLAIWSYSRFAREFDDSQFYRADLRRRGYLFYSLNDELPDGSIGRLFEAVIDWKNSTFLEDLSRDAKRGLREIVKNYGAVPGTPPRGFKREPVIVGRRRGGREHVLHRWAPDPDLVPKVRQAFAMRAAGSSLAEIHAATHLYGSLNSFQTFFKNKLYIGVLEYGDLVIENYCEPIIDKAIWDTVQSILKQYSARLHLKSTGKAGNPRHPRRVNSRYLLSGLLFCARCGSPMFGSSSSEGADKIFNRYACTQAYRRRDCDMKAVPQKAVEAAVLSTLREYILQPAVLQQHQHLIRTDQTRVLAKIAEQRAEIHTLLPGVRRRSANVTNAIAEGGHTRAMLDKLSALEAEETGLLAQLAELDRKAKLPLPDLSMAQITTLASDIHSALEAVDLGTVQRILRGFITRIVVDRQESADCGSPSITGMITYAFPLESDLNKSPPEHDTIPSSLAFAPMGAPVHRHTFTTNFTAKVRAYIRKRS